MKYTHTDKDGMKWRFEGSRPISQLADTVMGAVNLAFNIADRATARIKGVPIPPKAQKPRKGAARKRKGAN